MKVFFNTIATRFKRSPLCSVQGMAFALGLVFYALQAVAWPVAPGHDYTRYVQWFDQFFLDQPPRPMMSLYRTPVVPFWIGLTHEYLGHLGFEVMLAVGYGFICLLAYQCASTFGRGCGWLAVGMVFVMEPFNRVMRELASDSLFAVLFAGLTLLLVRWWASLTFRKGIILGLFAALLVLSRPSSQPLVLLGFALLLAPGTWRAGVGRAGAYLLAMLLVLVAYASYNKLRYDDFVIARGTAAQVPFYRVYTVDRIIRRENGPATRELYEAVEKNLLTHDLYRKYGITSDEIFQVPSVRIWFDLPTLADRTWGWRDHYKHLQRVGFEAVRAHPWPYAAGVLEDLCDDMDAPFRARFRPKLEGDVERKKALGKLVERWQREGIDGYDPHDLVPHNAHHWWLSDPTGILKTPQDNSRPAKERFGPRERYPVRSGSEAWAGFWRSLYEFSRFSGFWMLLLSLPMLFATPWRQNLPYKIMLLFGYLITGITYASVGHGIYYWIHYVPVMAPAAAIGVVVMARLAGRTFRRFRLNKAELWI
jgi:hypothetical protein